MVLLIKAPALGMLNLHGVIFKNCALQESIPPDAITSFLKQTVHQGEDGNLWRLNNVHSDWWETLRITSTNQGRSSNPFPFLPSPLEHRRCFSANLSASPTSSFWLQIICRKRTMSELQAMLIKINLSTEHFCNVLLHPRGKQSTQQ